MKKGKKPLTVVPPAKAPELCVPEKVDPSEEVTKVTEAAPEAPAAEPEKISPETEKKRQACLQLINCHDLLNRGRFDGFLNKRIGEALEFVGALHKQLVEELKTAPDAHLVPEFAPQPNQQTIQQPPTPAQ